MTKDTDSSVHEDSDSHPDKEQENNDADENADHEDMVALAGGSGMLYISSSAHPPQLVLAHGGTEEEDKTKKDDAADVDEEIGSSPKEDANANANDDDEESSTIEFLETNRSGSATKNQARADEEEPGVQSEDEEPEDSSSLLEYTPPRATTMAREAEGGPAEPQQQLTSCSDKDGKIQFRCVDVALAMLLGMLVSGLVYFLFEYTLASDGNDTQACVLVDSSNSNGSPPPPPASQDAPYYLSASHTLDEYLFIFRTTLPSAEDSLNYTRAAEWLTAAYVDSVLQDYFVAINTNDEASVVTTFVSSTTVKTGEYQFVYEQQTDDTTLRLWMPFRTTVNFFEQANSSGETSPNTLERALFDRTAAEQDGFRAFLLASATSLSAQDPWGFSQFLLYTKTIAVSSSTSPSSSSTPGIVPYDAGQEQQQDTPTLTPTTTEWNPPQGGPSYDDTPQGQYPEGTV